LQTAQSRQLHEDEDDTDLSDGEKHAEVVKILKEEARFDTITVWGHDRLPATDDIFVKGIDEWIAFAEAVRNSQCRYAHADDVLADSHKQTGHSSIFRYCPFVNLQESTKVIHWQRRQYWT
jgi:hypothetical protein